MLARAGSHQSAVSEDGKAFLKQVGFGEKFSSLEIQLFFFSLQHMYTFLYFSLELALIAANVFQERLRK